jgi:hypothetical protein
MLTAQSPVTLDSRHLSGAPAPSFGPGFVDDALGGDSRRESSSRLADGGLGRNPGAATWKVVYAIVERGPRKHWLRIGMAFVNRDGSLNVRLDAMPLSGQLHIRDNPPRDERETRENVSEPPPLPPLPFEREQPPLRARGRSASSPTGGA